MSLRLNQELRSWKVVLARLRRTETTWRGLSLSKVDHDTFTEAILCWAMVLNDLSNRYEGCGSYRDHVKFAQDCVKVDVSSLASFVSDSIVLWRQLSLTECSHVPMDYAGFKRQLAKDYPFAGNLLAPIRGAVEIYLEAPSPSSFYPVYQFLSFPNHLSLRDIDRASELEDEYVEQERCLAAARLPDSFILRMNEVMKDWLHDFRLNSSEFCPKHGPGGIAELPGDRSWESKYRLVQPDALISYVFRKHMGVDADEYAPCRDKSLVTSRTSRVVFVPKSMKTQRTISAEPATLQYFQQGVDREIRKYLSGHRYLSRRIDLNDQSIQQEAALNASRSRSFATVDLSAASDSIHYDLVKRVFRGTALYPFLVALRSRSTVLPSGKVVELTKFAPMGSSLTFPIETLIFACIVECTVRYVHATTGVLDNRFRVYGDDIIVPNICLDDLVVNLRWCGFRINEAKTYANSYRFRESCGCDAFDGVDVTPMRIGRKYSARRVTPWTPDVFSATISMANSAKEYGFLLLRRFLVDKLVNDTAFIPLFSKDGRYGVASTVPDNHRLTERWNDEYQRAELRATGVETTYPSDRKRTMFSPVLGRSISVADGSLDSEHIRYFECLRSRFCDSSGTKSCDYALTSGFGYWELFTSIPSPEDFVSGVTYIGSTGTILRKRWFSKPSVE